MNCVICGIKDHPAHDHFYGGWFNVRGDNKSAEELVKDDMTVGHESWDEQENIGQQIWAMELGYA